MKKLWIAVSFIISIVFLSGCTQQQYSVHINEDETVEFKINVSISESTVKQMQEYDLDTDLFHRNITTLFDPYIQQLEQKEFRVDLNSDTLSYGFTASKTYKSLVYFNHDIKKLNEEGIIKGLNIELSKKQEVLSSQYAATGELQYLIEDYFEDKTSQVSEWKSKVPISDMFANLTVSSAVGVIKGAKGSQDVQGNIINFTVGFNPDSTPITEQEKLEFGVSYSKENELLKAIIIIGGILIFIILFILWRVYSTRDATGNKMIKRKSKQRKRK